MAPSDIAGQGCEAVTQHLPAAHAAWSVWLEAQIVGFDAMERIPRIGSGRRWKGTDYKGVPSLSAVLLGTTEIFEYRSEGLDPLGGRRYQTELDVVDPFRFERMERFGNLSWFAPYRVHLV